PALAGFARFGPNAAHLGRRVQFCLALLRREACGGAAEPRLVRAYDRQAARSFSRQVGSSARRRRTRSLTGGCVTNSAARPSSANGLTVYSGSVAGLAWNSTN